MADVFFFTVNSVFPVVGIILLGYILRNTGFFDDKFIKTANKFVFKICLPVMLFYNIYNIGSIAEIKWDSVIFSAAMIGVLFAAGFITAAAVTKDGRRRGVVWQCVYRSNFALIGFSLAEALFGDEGAAAAALLSGFTIPLYNVFAVISLSVFNGNGKRISFKKLFSDIVKNPLIIGAGLGLAVLAVRAPIREYSGFSLRENLPFVYTVLKQISAVASPLALIVLGGQFKFSAARSMAKEIIVSSAARIVAAPVLALTAAAFLTKAGITNFGGAEYAAFIALFGTPVAVSSAIMAGAMDNDEQLASQLVVWTSVCSVFTVFAIIFAAKLLCLL